MMTAAKPLLTGLSIVLLISCAGWHDARDSEAIPKPSTNRIDYARPEQYLELTPSLGSADHILQVARPLKEKTAEETLRAIGRWMESYFRYDPRAAYRWRDFDSILDEGAYGGCADHSVVFGALARACGIPTVWVKSMDADWIREFRADPDRFGGTWRGHVFLEVHLGTRWALLDATQGVLYEDYDPRSRILPGVRLAYDKSGDPYEVVLSSRWEEWKIQTRRYFRELDLSLLPVPSGRDLRNSSADVFIVANAPVWQWIHARCEAFRLRPCSFNIEFDRYVPLARGRRFIVACLGDEMILPAKYHATHLPVPLAELKAQRDNSPRGCLRRKTGDGTELILLHGRTLDDLRRAVDELVLE